MATGEQFESFLQSEVEKCAEIFRNQGVEGCQEYLKQKLEAWKKVSLNIAVIGASGVGKSSFINAIRNLTADDDGAAAVCAEDECTEKPTPYSHPNNDLIKFWDLPGTDTHTFPKATYLETIKIDCYDCFLLLAACRFTENDIWLVSEITKRDKTFYFVRTKVADDVRNDKKDHPRTHNEQAWLQKTRDVTEQHLRPLLPSHIQSQIHSKISLIDNHEKDRFDFSLLESNLVNDLPELKRQAMILSMGSFSEQMIKLKAAELRKMIFAAAATSAVVAAIPVPNLSLLVDSSVVFYMGTLFYNRLGLDDDSLRKHAIITRTNFEELRDIVRKEGFVGIETFTAQGIRSFLQGLGGASIIFALEVAEESIRLASPIGSLIAAPASYKATSMLMNLLLDKMESTMVEVVRYAAKHCIDVK